jgi:hypothetical protein
VELISEANRYQQSFLTDDAGALTVKRLPFGVWLANCYFAHNSLEFPVLLGFCDAAIWSSFSSLSSLPWLACSDLAVPVPSLPSRFCSSINS